MAEKRTLYNRTLAATKPRRKECSRRKTRQRPNTVVIHADPCIIRRCTLIASIPVVAGYESPSNGNGQLFHGPRHKDIEDAVHPV